MEKDENIKKHEEEVQEKITLADDVEILSFSMTLEEVDRLRKLKVS